MSSFYIRAVYGEKGAAFKATFFLVLTVFLILAVIAYTFGYVVPPGMMGVRQVNFGPGQGFSETGLEPGYHWSIPFYTRIHVIPKRTEVLHFQRDLAERGQGFGALEIQTTDGATVDVDISILMKFYSRRGAEDGLKHGGPADLVNTIGLTPDKWNNHIRRVADNEMRRSLGKLITGEFYDPHKREAYLQEAFANMNENLAMSGIKIEAVLIRRYTYRSERIDNAIFQKNLQAQEERYNKAAAALSTVRAEVVNTEAEWDAKIATLRVEGQKDAQVIISKANLYESEMKAKGDLGVARARAEVDKLRASALARSEGASIYVAREMAPLLSSLKGGVVGDLDPYNLEDWMKRLGIDQPQ